MNEINNLSLDTIKAGLAAFFGRFHLVLYVIFVVGGLAVAVFLIYQIILQATDVSTVDTQPASTFDQATIEKLESLHSSSENIQPLNLPENQRVNPFVD